MNPTAENPRAIIFERLRNSAIYLVLMSAGGAVAHWIATAIGGDVRRAYLIGIAIGCGPAICFLARNNEIRIRWWEYVGAVTLFIEFDQLSEHLQLGAIMRAILCGGVWLVLISLYRRYFLAPP